MTKAETPKEPIEEVVEDKPLNVYQRLSKACEIIGSQAWVRDMSNSQYKSIPIDAMRNGVRSACVAAGLIHIGPIGLVPEKVQVDRTTHWYGTCTFRYVNVDDPEDFVDFDSFGESMDNGDKGIGKLISNLIKNHYKTTFDIGEQGEDDVDHYSNEDIYDEADRIEEKRRSRQKAASNDRFFGKNDKPKDKPKDDYAGIPSEEKRAAIVSWQDVPLLRDRIKAALEIYGPIDKWRDSDVVQIYASCRRDLDKEGQA